MFRLLILDDEKNERDCLRFLIEKAGLPFEMRDVDNAFAALDILCTWQADVILTDIQMPAMNGLDFIQKVSQLYPDIKLIIFSNYAEFEYAGPHCIMGWKTISSNQWSPQNWKTPSMPL